ncbi:MAG TPA: 3'-5' exonuclease [Paracoccaceae bacterium]|nr:3'-5' exonuclease [Paracoccaceae bacterium]
MRSALPSARSSSCHGPRPPARPPASRPATSPARRRPPPAPPRSARWISRRGLEFRAVAVMACDEDIVPLASRLDGAANESELREAYETERHLLYVACTRARDRLMVSGVVPASEFLEDLAT